ncbi:secreted Ly-6/uPAR domain-containing protein 2 [Sorex fumeus]|uniref:secreted Ly-6/uPAR domain-containing protein 2 n=1 Tax=Sorex fumeus TaxID=62283 RepID=UPI0024AD620A|nr:secreted Ly-6/uPAR domain-containing protein 2 [Sorex fumeus]
MPAPAPDPPSAAGAMECHRCKGFGSCHHRAKCPPNSDHCVTIATRVTAVVPDLPLVLKKCSRGCPEPASLGLGPHVSVSCCQASVCNQA